MITRDQDTKVAEERDTEITLSVGNLLALFFGLVVLCGVSLAVGYSLGRNSAKQAAAAAADVPPVTTQTSSAANKPGASQVAPAKVPDAPAPTPSDPAATPSGTPLTFYDSVQTKDAHPQLTPPEQPVAAPAKPADNRATLGAGYLVQIAAVRNQDDAKLLSDALQKQKYPVIITQPGDKLFHVQVGPYADVKEANAIRDRLISAGYNAFLKR